MEQSEQDKSELPTHFKLTRAREKGVVARGTDLGFVTGLAAFLGFAWVVGPQAGGAIANAYRGAFIGGIELADGDGTLLDASARLFAPVAELIILMAAAIFLVVLLFEIVQTGVVFSSKPLAPDFSRLNPANGFKRVFSLRLLIETLKNALKLCTYTTVAVLVVRAVLASDIATVLDGGSLAAAMSRSALRLLALFALCGLFFAALDQLIVRRDFLKKMRMSRRELRREARDREGEPRLKQRRKQLHAQFAKTSQSLKNIRRADVLVTNPEHIAVALRYDAAMTTAPLVVSVGINHMAQKLKRLALLYGVPVIENRALARELFKTSGLNAPIAPSCFKAVADIYIAIRKSSAPLRMEGADA